MVLLAAIIDLSRSGWQAIQSLAAASLRSIANFFCVTADVPQTYENCLVL